MKPADLICLIIFIIACILGAFNKETKQALAKYYNITRPTLAKWIRYFQSDFTEEQWQAKRTLVGFEVQKIKNTFGSDPTCVLSKKQIAERSGSDYKTVAAMVKRHSKKIGLTEEAWKACNCFPPTISQKILDILG